MTQIDEEAAATVNDITKTDALILDCLADGRNAPSNIADEIERHPKHVSDRLGTLRDRGLVRTVGRDAVSLHEITKRGRRILDIYRDFQAALKS